ncbi:hypothetical protein JRO89_XS12G0074700 [Xanthoceras sorbifolium]|uniref:Integrator complex subunit 4/Protein SIEL C-terminal Ig-like domain-containing protein n=1 Tax=Xanthoceras sorbifolium TaxID=99658 RepID=A0ABQ8HBQ3_9ROSI|nr:hypothetical protein JRO89_XS12G0074700 [Xanthoceras sorbifolium]
MELQRQQILQTCEQSLSLSKPLSLQALAAIRSLVNNIPNTSDSTLSSILETLNRSLQVSAPDSLTSHHHTLKLLTDLSLRHHPRLSRLVFDSLSSGSLSLLSSGSARLSADCLAALVSISEQDPDLVFKVDGRLFVSLCFAPCVTVRLWLLRNAERFGVGTRLLFTVLLGFTKDPYPYVRRVALDGLSGLCKSGVFEDVDVIKGCYCRAVELLLDAEDCVRRATVRVIDYIRYTRNVIGNMSANGVKCLYQDAKRIIEQIGSFLDLVHCKCNQFDNWMWLQLLEATELNVDVWLTLCSMVRDMSMEVRVEAFDALGKIGLVSEDILLQTLSKKVLGVIKEKKSRSQCTEECFEISASAAAGAFLHGLEDEFYEVRKSACSSLRSFAVFSEKFAGEALNLLVDMVNDDSVAVRLQALETMHHMATCDCLKVQEKHMHMFLGTLVDSCDYMYPQDEADVFSVLFNIGRSHGKFAVRIIEEVAQEIEPDCNGKLGFDSASVAAFLVLAISIPLSCDQIIHCISPRIFSYAVTLLGRISRALSEFMNQDSLLAYLSQCSRLSSFSSTEFKGQDQSLHQVKSDNPDHSSTEISSAVKIPVQEIGDEASETQSWMCKLRELVTAEGRCHLEVDDEIIKSMNLVLIKVKNVWSLVQSGYTKEVLKILRFCKEEVLTFNTESLGSDGALAFTWQYLQVVKLLAKAWEHFMPRKKLSHIETGELELLLGKLERRLREIRCRFIGLSKEEELHVLELIILTCLMRLSKVEICCYLTTMKKLASTTSHIECLCKEVSIEPSKFVIEVRESLLEISTSSCGTSFSSFPFNQLLDSFFLKKLMLCRNIRHIRAKLDIPDNSSENPLPFVSGLPVAIPLDITLHNMSTENRLWLRITTSEESTRYVFLDPDLFGECSKVQKLSYTAPFYMTPNSFVFMHQILAIIYKVSGCYGLLRTYTKSPSICKIQAPRTKNVFDDSSS